MKDDPISLMNCLQMSILVQSKFQAFASGVKYCSGRIAKSSQALELSRFKRLTLLVSFLVQKEYLMLTMECFLMLILVQIQTLLWRRLYLTMVVQICNLIFVIKNYLFRLLKCLQISILVRRKIIEIYSTKATSHESHLK